MHHKFYLLFLVCIFSFNAFSQSKTKAQCEANLKEAIRAFEEGKINDVRNLLEKECLDQLDKTKRADAHRLLTMSGLYTDDRALAENNMEKFIRLKISPKFELTRKGDGAEEPEFLELYDKFNIKPVYLYGFKLGATYSLVQPTKVYSIDNNSTPGNYNPRIGVLLGGMFDLPINEHLHADIEAYYATRGFVHTDSLLNFAQTTFTESQSIVEVPIYARYLFGSLRSNFRPYVSAGVFANYLLSSNAEVIRNDKVGSGNTETKREVELLNVSMSDQRNKLGFGAMFGAGFLLKTAAGFFTFDIRYNMGLSNLVNPANRGNNEILYGRYGYVDDDMVMSPISLSVGFYLPKYNPRLKKQHRRTETIKKGRKKKGRKKRRARK